MKHLRESFEDLEWEKLMRAKEKTGLSWHDFIMTLTEEKK